MTTADARTFVTTATEPGTPLGTSYGTFNGSYVLGNFWEYDAEGNGQTYFVLGSLGTSWFDVWVTTDTELRVWEGPAEDAPEPCPIDARVRAQFVTSEHHKHSGATLTRNLRDENRKLRQAAAEDARAVAAAVAERDAMQTERDAWQNNGLALGLTAAWEKFQDIGAEVAEDANFCGEYERVGEGIAERLGLEFRGRERDWNVDIDTCGTTVTVRVTGRNETEARDAVTDTDVRNALIEYLRESYNSLPDWEVENIERD